MPNAFVHVLTLVLLLKNKKMLLLASLYVFITQCNKLYFQYSCHGVIKCFINQLYPNPHFHLINTKRSLVIPKLMFSSFVPI